MLQLLLGKMIGCLIQGKLVTWRLEEMFLNNLLTMLMEHYTLQTSQNSSHQDLAQSRSNCLVFQNFFYKMFYISQSLGETFYPWSTSSSKDTPFIFFMAGWGHKSITSLTFHDGDRRRKTSKVVRHLCSCTKLLI